MKKIIVVFALLLILSAIAQNFPYRNIELLIGKEVQIIPLNETELKYSAGYKDFSTDVKGIYTYQEGRSITVTKPSALADRVFKVESIESNPISTGASMLKLKDSKGEIIYYKYKKDSLTPFKILGGIVLPENYYCQYIEESTDKSTGEQTFKVKNYAYELTKLKKGKIIKYTIFLETTADMRGDDGKGVIVLLENNKRIVKPTVRVKLKMGITGSYSATFELTPADIALLRDNKIIDFSLFENDGFIHPDQAEVFQGALECMLAN